MTQNTTKLSDLYMSYMMRDYVGQFYFNVIPQGTLEQVSMEGFDWQSTGEGRVTILLDWARVTQPTNQIAVQYQSSEKVK